MSLRKINKLRHVLLIRLAVLYALAFVSVSLISFSVFYYYIYSSIMQHKNRELSDKVELYSKAMAEHGLEGVKDRIADESEAEDPNEEFYRLIDLSGNTLMSTNMASWSGVDKTESLRKLQEGSPSYQYQSITLPGRNEEARMISARIGSDVVVQIGETFGEVDEYLESFRNLLMILVSTLIVLSAVIGWLLARRALADMKAVTQTAEDIFKGAFDRRVRIKGQFEEIKKLGATFNRMLDRIQHLLKSMKEINDNIAHDLRSPLARIRGIAEMTLTTEKSLGDYKDMAVNTIEECDKLIDMINTMLDITEAEAGVKSSRDEAFDLVELISEATDLFRPLADQKRMNLNISLPEALTFQGDRKKIQRIVTNILENSIKYSREGGTVTISAAKEDGRIQVEFKDNGIGIAPIDLPHIFDRFYRCDRSRTEGGVGLGLSLAKAYAETMNGSIEAESTLGQGSTFVVTFVQ